MMKSIPYDKKMHFVAGFLIALVSIVIVSFLYWLIGFSIIWIPVFVTTVPIIGGLVKEILDYKQKNNKFDFLDLLFTVLGSLIVSIPVWFII